MIYHAPTHAPNHHDARPFLHPLRRLPRTEVRPHDIDINQLPDLLRGVLDGGKVLDDPSSRDEHVDPAVLFVDLGEDVLDGGLRGDVAAVPRTGDLSRLGFPLRDEPVDEFGGGFGGVGFAEVEDGNSGGPAESEQGCLVE